MVLTNTYVYNCALFIFVPDKHLPHVFPITLNGLFLPTNSTPSVFILQYKDLSLDSIYEGNIQYFVLLPPHITFSIPFRSSLLSQALFYFHVTHTHTCISTYIPTHTHSTLLSVYENVAFFFLSVDLFTNMVVPNPYTLSKIS